MADPSSSPNLRKPYKQTDSLSLLYEFAKVFCFKKKSSRVLIGNNNNITSSSTTTTTTTTNTIDYDDDDDDNNNKSDFESYSLKSINKYSFPNSNDDDFTRLNLEHCLLRFQWQSNFSSPMEQRLLSGGTRVLDVGCGSGAWILDMAREFNPSNTYIGIDNLPIFPNEDSRLPNTGFIQCNLLNGIPFPDSTFDFVYERFVAYFDLTSSQWNFLFSEMKRVLKPGGYLEIMEYCVDYDSPGPLTRTRNAQILRYLNSKGIHPETTVCSIPQMMQSTKSLYDFHKQDRFGPIGCWGGDFGLITLNNYEMAQKALNEKLYKGLSEEELEYVIASTTNEFDNYKTQIGNFRCFARKKISYFGD